LAFVLGPWLFLIYSSFFGPGLGCGGPLLGLGFCIESVALVEYRSSITFHSMYSGFVAAVFIDEWLLQH